MTTQRSRTAWTGDRRWKDLPRLPAFRALEGIYLSRQAYHDLHVAEPPATLGDFQKDTQMFGVPVAIFGVELESHRLRKSLKRWLSDSVAGPRWSRCGAVRRIPLD
jgi:hypothetical protein